MHQGFPLSLTILDHVEIDIDPRLSAEVGHCVFPWIRQKLLEGVTRITQYQQLAHIEGLEHRLELPHRIAQNRYEQSVLEEQAKKKRMELGKNHYQVGHRNN